MSSERESTDMQFTIEPTGIEVPDLVLATTGEPDSACVTVATAAGAA